MKEKKRALSPAIQVILIFGIISMLGDVIYESARGVNSQYFNLIGVSATKVGIVFGIGELFGYFLRLFAGYWSDVSHKHWLFIFIGYGMLIVVPLMGMTLNWNLLVVFILLERLGKALRNPAKDTILSSVAEKEVNLGMAFGLQEALDQLGAFIGPLIFTGVFYFTGRNGLVQYQMGYKALIIPFILLMAFVYYAYRTVEKKRVIPEMKIRDFDNRSLKGIFWVYTAFIFATTLGFANFAIIGYHLKDTGLLGDGQITMVYSFAMVVDALAALAVGKAYDSLKEKTKLRTGGILILGLVPLFTMGLPFLTLSYSVPLIVLGMFLWGLVMGAHETVMKSAIGDLVPFSKRGRGYGVFNAAYGLALFFGASYMGFFYDQQKTWLIFLLCIVCEIFALFLYRKMQKMIHENK